MQLLTAVWDENFFEFMVEYFSLDKMQLQEVKHNCDINIL